MGILATPPQNQQAHLGIWDLRRREALIVNRNIFEFHGPRCTTDPLKRTKSTKNGNDLCDLDFDLVTLRSSGYVDLLYTYL